MSKILYICKTFIWSLKHLIIAAPYEIVIVLFFIILQGFIPAASLYAIQGIIHWVSTSSTFPFFYVTLWGGMCFADVILRPVISTVRLHLNERMLTHCNLLLMEKANAIQGLGPFENAQVYDEMQFLKNESSRRPLNFVYVFTDFTKEVIALLTILFVLSSLEWWIPLGMLCVGVPHAISTLWFEKQSWDQMFFRSPESRKLAWLSSLTMDDRAAKEVRLFGFGDFLTAKYKKIAITMHQVLSKERWRQSLFSVFLSSLTVLGSILLTSAVLLRAKSGMLEISGLVIIIQALITTQSLLIGCSSYIGMLAPILLFFDKLKTFLSASICTISKRKAFCILGPIEEIRFEDVSFSYPDERAALSRVSFTIRKGEKIAIIGQNGAGKSTLVKLLLRFYEPSEGIITVNGKDLRTIELKHWRSLISGVFQDFGQYHLTVGENIALKDIRELDHRVNYAAVKGSCNSVIEKLPDKLQALLGKELGGTSLSGGEWQKIAMARAFFKESQILILDEPTGALDPKSEHEVYQKFAENTENKTTFFITHRLGSVKMVDRILVLKNGELIESGTHEELSKKEGEYTYLFSLQAMRFGEKTNHSLMNNANSVTN